MDRFITKKPKSNNKSDDKCSAANEKEETSQTIKRKFRVEWLTTFEWLQEKDGYAFCVACSKSLTSHVSHLKDHEKTALHVKNYALQKNNLKIQKFFNNEQQRKMDQVKHVEFTLVMFCITHNLPFLLMDYLPQLLVECCPDSAIAKLVRCGRTKATEIADSLGNQASENIIATLKMKKFSLIVDGSTDISSNKCFVLIARFINDACEIQDKFLTMLEITKSDSQSIFNKIKNFFEQCKIPMQNLIGLGTDGENSMSGDIGGLKALFLKETDLFYIKCSCHALHHCSSYATKKLPKAIEILCRHIYTFFARSPKRINELKEFQEYCSVAPHKILGICNTRWLSLEGVIVRIIEQWDSLKLYFISCAYEVQGITAARIAEEMTCEVKSYFLFLSYILPIINNLNKEFQSENSRLPYLYPSIKSNYLLILSNFIKKELIKIKEIDIDYNNELNYLDISNIFIGIKAENYIKTYLNPSEKIEVKTAILNFYIELLNQINMRIDFKSDNIKLLNMITPQKVISNEDLSILHLVLKFPKLVESDPDLIVTEWNLLRLSEVQLSSDLNINDFWGKVASISNGLDEKCFVNLTKFIFNLLSLPHSSAAAERKFSTLSLIKTKLRNKLELNTVNNIMLCKELIKNDKPHYVWSAKTDLHN